MPGIVGFHGGAADGSAEALIRRMAGALEEEEWYKTDLYWGDTVSLGRVTLGFGNDAKQPVWNEAETVALVMAGELYDYEEGRRELIAQGHRFQTESAAEFLLHLHEEHGEGCAERVNGAFAAAIWDKRTQTLSLVNDRLGLQPLYYTELDGKLYFASGVRALLAVPDMPRKVNRTAIVELLTFDFALEDRTLVEAAKLLPPASILRFSGGHAQLRRYWRMSPSEHDYRSESSYVEEVGALLERAVRRQRPGNEQASILLSGGLDSRVLLGFLAEDDSPGGLTTLTFGIPGCDDGRFARAAAKAAKTSNEFVEIEGDYLIAGAEKAVRLTDGLSNCVHAQALQPFLSNSSYGTVVYKGYLGDELMGYHGSRTLLADCSREGTLKAFLDHEPCIVPPAEQSRLLAEQMRPLTDHALETCESLLASFEATTTLERIIAFCLQQRQRRMTLNGVHLVRSQRTVRTPFCDNDLVDFMLAAPPGLRLDRYLMKKTFTERFPALAKVPFTGTGLPLTTCFEDLWIRFKSQASWRVRAAGLKSFPVPRVAPYTDYAGWMRAHLRGWVEETLLSERALERGYFCPVRLRQLVAEHMDGSDHSMKLGQLLSIELWHRQFLD